MTHMTKSFSLVVLTGIFVALCSTPALAQAPARQGTAVDRPLFLDINAAFGGKPGALNTGSTFSLFGENGSAATRVEPGTSAMFDIRLGYRLAAHLGIAGAMSGGQSETVGTTAASIPSPIRFASPSIVSLDAPGLKRRELGFHLQAVYFMALRDNVVLTIAGGPSVVHLQQGVPSVTVTGSTPLVGSINESGNGLGGHVGADLTSLFSAHYGAGVFVRYVAASLNLPSASSVKVGGVQAGAGVRIRF